MKRNWISIFLLVFLAVVFISSCDDAGVSYWPPNGEIGLSLSNFGTLDPNVDGIYEVWVKLDSQGVPSYYSMGRFNISPGGAVVDPSGSAKIFRLSVDTSKLNLSKSAFITVEPPGDFDPYPSSRILISSGVIVTQDSIYGTLTIGGDEALGAVGQRLIVGVPGYYIFDTPTDNSASCFRGIWFCDSNGISMLPGDLALGPGSQWVYQAWVVDTSQPGTPINYSVGRFRDPNGPDYDGAGPCSGPNPAYTKPGQDWVLSGCPPGKPMIVNLKNGWYQVQITLEPQDETPGSAAYESPFFLKLFRSNYINPASLCRIVNLMTLVFSQTNTFPRARLKITYHVY